jgi:hypothetical protein
MTYFVRWLKEYGWHVYAAASPNSPRVIHITGWSTGDLGHILTWCGSTSVTILPCAA